MRRRSHLSLAGAFLLGSACGLDEEGGMTDPDASLADVTEPGDASWIDGGDGEASFADQITVDVADGSDVQPDVMAEDAEAGFSDAPLTDTVADAGCFPPGTGPQGFRFKWYSAANWKPVRLDAEIDLPPLGSPDVPWTQGICMDQDSASNVWDCYVMASMNMPCGSIVRLNVLINDGTSSGSFMCNTQGCIGYPGEYAVWNGGSLVPVQAHAVVEPVQPCEAGSCTTRLKITVP